MGELVQLRLIEPIGVREGHVIYDTTAHAREMSDAEINDVLGRDSATTEPADEGPSWGLPPEICDTCGHLH